MGNFLCFRQCCGRSEDREEMQLDLVSNINEDKAIFSILASVIGNLAGIPILYKNLSEITEKDVENSLKMTNKNTLRITTEFEINMEMIEAIHSGKGFLDLNKIYK